MLQLLTQSEETVTWKLDGQTIYTFIDWDDDFIYLYFGEKTCKLGNDNNRKSKSYYNEIVATVDVKNQIVKHLVNCQGIRSICWLLYFQMERSIYLH